MSDTERLAQAIVSKVIADLFANPDFRALWKSQGMGSKKRIRRELASVVMGELKNPNIAIAAAEPTPPKEG